MMFDILGTAGIDTKLVIPMVQTSEYEAAATVPHDEARTSIVADELGIPTAYGSYETLLADDPLNTVYIPLPNDPHANWVRAAADRGLHVFYKKPLTVSANETTATFDYCEDVGVTLMETFVYRFHPLTERTAELVASELDVIVSVTSSFSLRLPDGADGIHIDPDPASGGVMDVDCYAVSVTRLSLGTPDRVHTTVTDTRDCGVGARMSGVLEYDSGTIARVKSSFGAPEMQYYCIQTTDGRLEVNPAFNVNPTVAAELTYVTDSRVVMGTFDPTGSYRRRVEVLVRAAETGRALCVDREEPVSVMRVIDAIYESAETGAAVGLD